MTFGETLTREPAAYGGFADAIGGIATIVLAILALAGIYQDVLGSIAVIVFGVALLIQGGTMLGEWGQLIFPMSGGARGATAVQFSGGNSLAAVFLTGCAGIVLGILALIGIHPAVLVSVGVIAFGAALVLGSHAVWQLYILKRASAMTMTGTAAGQIGGEFLASEMASGSAGMQALGGLSAVVLGILALTNATYAATLFLVALIVLGAIVVLTGSTLTGIVLSFMPRGGEYRYETRTGQAE
jgi:uncharacterized integral membrane protein